MRRLVPFGLLACLMTVSIARADSRDPLSARSADPPSIEILAESAGRLTLLFELPDLEVREVEKNGETYQAVEIPGGALAGDVGTPGIPTFSRMIAVPDGAAVRVVSRRLETEERSDVHLMPLQKGSAGEEEDFAYDAAAYAVERIDDEVDVVAGDPAKLRDLSVVNLTFRPVHYNPAARSLTVAKRFEVEVAFDGGGADKTASARAALPSFDRLYDGVVVNYDRSEGAAEPVPGTILVITQSSAAVTDSIQPWIEWRTRKGAPVIHATTSETGSTRNSIKSYIQGVYDDPAVDLEYVVLVGDVAQIPTWFESLSGYGGEGDLPYSQLDGSDVLADVHIGRLSYSTMDELSVMVHKVIGYESTPYTSDATWFTRGFVVGDPTSSGYSCVETGRWAKNLAFTQGYTEVDTAFSSSFVSKMLTALNRGDTFFGYRGYYHMSGWSNGYTNTLTNGWRLPFVIIITCDTGSFSDDGSARSEGFLRAGSAAPVVPRGAVGAIGMATIGTHTRYNNCLFYGVHQGLLGDTLETMGASLTRGQTELYLNYQMNEPNTVKIWSHWCNLMGDPAVDVFTAYPASISVDHPASITLGENSITVTVTEGPSAVEGALVCAWKGNETYAAGRTDASGVAVLPLTNTTTGDLLLTVTKHNKYPYLATVPVSSGDHVGYIASTVDDDASGGSGGNGDGLINPTETIELSVELQNFGGATETAVQATLTSDDPFVTITDASEDFGDIGAGDTAWCAEDYDVHIAPDCPHGHVLRFGLDATSGPDVWHSIFDLSAVSSELVYNGRTFYGDGGNGPDPGETVDLSVDIRNDGDAWASSVTGTLQSNSSYIAVLDSIGTFGSFGSGGSGENTGDHFTITAASNTYEGYLANLDIICTFSGGRIDTVPVSFTIGQVSSDDPVGPDAYGYYAFDDIDTAYPEAPTYGWIEIDPSYGGDGTDTGIYDGGGYNDDARVFALPFPFTYYGVSYDSLTICSNGWLSMGRSPSVSYRNWTIPGAGGPDAMIAPFWDNLYQSGGAKVAHKYDAANDRYIVEWSRMRNDYGGATETFEVILYDPSVYTTDTGDGIILFQYDAVTVTDPTNGYVTVGIENHEQNDGLLVTYFNRYSSGAATLSAGRAIRFLPVAGTVYGTLEGTVVNASNGNTGLDEVSVTVTETGRSFTTAAGGTYSGLVPPGTYTVVASHVGFAPDTASGVLITENQTTQQDFSLVDIAAPVITTIPQADTEDSTGPYTISATIEEYSALPQRTLYYRPNWDSKFTAVQLDSLGDFAYEGDIPGMPYATIVGYFIYARDAAGYETVDPPGAPDSVYSFIVAPIATLLDDDFESNQGWTVGAPDDDATTGIWERVDPIGTQYNGSDVQPEDDYSTDGTLCYVTQNGAVGGQAGQNDVDNGKTSLFSPVFDLSPYTSATVSYAVWYSNDVGNNPGQDTWLVQVTDDGSTWTDLENTTASTDAWVVRNFTLQDYVSLTNQVQFLFVASDEGGASLVEAAVDEFLLTATEDLSTGVTAEDAPPVLAYGLDPCRPNPFNPQTTITFRMPEAGKATLRIYDVSGRVVATLADGDLPAGEHHLRWDGRSAAGRDVTSGVYFVRFEAPGFLQVRQMTLIR